MDQVCGRGAQLVLGLVGGIGVEDAGLRLDHLAQRPVGDAITVGQRTPLTPRDEVGVAFDHLHQLPHQAALADTRYAHHRHQLHGPLRAATAKCIDQQIDLLSAPDQRRGGPLHHVDPQPRPRLDNFPHRQRL